MRIDSAISHVPPGQQIRQAKADEKLIKDQQKVVEQQELEAPEEEQPGCKGVLRLLQEGHFKGVADVRLRINFHEEIAALEQQNINEQASQSANELKNELSATARNIITEAGLAQEQTDEAVALVDNFETAVGESLSNFQNESESALDQLIADIKSAYDNLVGRLNEILNPASVEPTSETEETSELEPPIVELPIWQTELNSVFTAAIGNLSNLNDSVASLLPPISDPSGNGKAFDKLMAIYNNMLSEPTLDVMEPEFEAEPLPA